MTTRNLQVRMARHPQGELVEGDFEFTESEKPSRAAGQVLVRNVYLSLDPYMRPMMDPVRSYVPHLNPGDLMPGFGVGQVVDSDSDEFPIGAYVTGRFGWQQYAAAAVQALRRVDPALGPISTAVGVLGMPGATAHYGLMQIGRPKSGDTVVVSAASGAVGSLVGQIAKLNGCRVVGIAGGPDKCRYVVDELGFDACLDYRAPGLERRFAEATPDFVDVSFENVGGPIMDMVMARLNAHARVVLCGAISQYGKSSAASGFPVFELVRQRATLTGFIISEHMEHWPSAFADISRWIAEGKVKYRESIADGLHAAPAAFMGMLTGRNFGKQLVRVGAESC
ncbi:MAG TPA: NADP-dependent oxidoreductase [Burkholderiaceae bacterium]|nr:NADP-dependent oxidoreductase [Burkholderiaceae bacterium]